MYRYFPKDIIESARANIEDVPIRLCIGGIQVYRKKIPNDKILTYGYYRENNNFIAYRTNERAGIYLKKICSSEDEVLELLLRWLRNKKIMEED